MNNKTIGFLFKINDLQKTNRYGNYPEFIESTSEHTFKLIQMVDYFYQTLDLKLDYYKCIRLAIYHDFGEMDLEKDVDIKENTNLDIKLNKDKYELEKIDKLSSTYYEPIKELFNEYKNKETEEAKFINACDKLEGTIYPLTKNIPVVNHELYATYADKAIKNFPLLLPLYKEVKEIMKTKYLEWGFIWKEEYEEVFNN